jgi:TolA-binding protein
MRRLKQFIYAFSLPMLIIIPYACTPTAERPVEDSFFAPLDTVARKNAKSAGSQIAIGDSQAIIADEKIKRSIAGTIMDQNRRLNDMIQELDNAEAGASADSLRQKKYGDYSPDFIIDKKISNEVLLEMVNETNRKIDNVMDKLRVFTNEQQKTRNKLDSGSSGADNKETRQASSSAISNSSYAGAINLYKQNKYKSAIMAFQALLKAGTDITLQDNCHFWIGVCHFIQKRPNGAVSEFSKVIDIPGSDKKEGAYFMIGQCYEQLGMKNHARNMFRKTIREYPDGDLKQVAEIKLALLR